MINKRLAFMWLILGSLGWWAGGLSTTAVAGPFVTSDGVVFQEQDQEPESGSIEDDADDPSIDRDKAEESDPERPEAEESEQAEPDSERSRSKRSRRRGVRSFSKRSEDFIAVFSPAVASTADAVVVIADGDEQLALGTVVDADGLILTKSSELRGELRCRLANGKSLEPIIVGVDPKTDLVLLQVDAQELNYARLEDLPQPEIGSWLATVDQDDEPLTVGIVSHEAREIPDVKLNSAVIGIFPEDREQGDGVRINRVVNDSPAEEAGLLVNDVIVAIDKDPILTRAELMEKLSHYQPGDEIVLTIRRSDEESDVPLTLGKRRINPMMDRGSRQNRMGSTLSRRRSDFPLAVQHDSNLNANEIGGPVVNLDGRVVGINIARDGRVSSLALPNAVVLPVIKKLRTGKYRPATVFKRDIQRIEKQLAKLSQQLGDLPEKKTEKEIEYSAGSAIEKELDRQIKETETRLSALKKRREETKKSNRTLLKAITEIDAEQERIEEKREPLQRQLQQLKTGIR